eukprot:scaffold127379_cov52-Attheya_sp.AAC.4
MGISRFASRNKSACGGNGRFLGRTLMWFICWVVVVCPSPSFAFATSPRMSMSAAAAATGTTTGKTKPLVVVTGGSRGIGRATCLLLASRGYDVAVNYQSNAKGAEAVVTDIEAAGGHARAFQADVSEESQVTQLFDDVVKAFGRAPNGLVNNAGIMEPWLNDIATIEFDTLERDIRTNLYGP